MSNARDDREWRERNPRGEFPNSDIEVTSAEEIGIMHLSTENFSAALDYFNQALHTPNLAPYPDKFRILLRICDCHRKRGSYADAERLLAEARAVVQGRPDDVAAARMGLREAAILMSRAEYDECLEVAFAAYRGLKGTNLLEEVASLQTVIGHAYMRLGMSTEAEDFFADALSSHRRAEDEVGIATAYNNLGLLHKAKCRWSRALACLTRSRDKFRELGISQNELVVEINLAAVYLKTRRFPEAVSALTNASTAADRLGDSLALTMALLMLGRTLVQTGQFTKAERHLVRAQAVATEMGYGRETALAEEYIGELMLRRGKIDCARKNLESALERGRDIAPEGDIVAECVSRLAIVEYRANNIEQALKYVEEGLSVAPNSEPYETGFIERTRARCLARLGRIDQAMDAIEVSVDVFAAHGLPYEKAISQQYLARLKARSSDESDLLKAKQLLGESIVEFSRLDEGVAQVESHIMLASIEQRLGNIDEALLAVYEADRIADEENAQKFRPALTALRNKIENRMTRSTSKVLDQFSVLNDIQSGAKSRQQLSKGLGATLELIGEKLKATAGFVSIPKPTGRSLEILARHGISARNANAIESWIAKREDSAPGVEVISDVDTREDMAALRERVPGLSGSLLVQTLGFEGENLGILCVQQSADDARQPWGQDALHFVTAYASLISLTIYELIRSERRGQRKPLKQTAAKGFQAVVTENEDMIKLLNLAERVAHSDATVLLQGETGTGKGLIAYAIHLLSERRERKFIHVNCAALPEQLLESELFGHARGSFTGAISEKLGLLEEANGGTIFLDEIGKTSVVMQGKLLQFLDTSKVRRVGANESVPVDVRVVCASKSNLLDMCEKGTFLEDFFYRINDFPLTVPPLRERKEDIELLMYHYIEKISRDMGKEISGATDAFVEALRNYRWPGNVRELEKIIKRAVILADDGDALDECHVAAEVMREPEAPVLDVHGEIVTLKERVEQLEQAEIARVLRRHDGNKSQAAIELGISYPNLLSKIKRYNIQ